MRHNGERRPEEIQAEIARTRGDMDATLSAIEQRLTPGQLMDQGIDYLRHSGGREFVSNLGGSVKNNPLPVALMGIGLAWLMATGNRRPSYLEPGGEGGAMSGIKERTSGIKERTSGMMERASERMSSTRERMSQTAQSARERIGHLGGRARSGMEGMRHRAERMRGGYDSMVREQPLALGAIGLAIGALAAAFAPRTRQEDELMGEASDRLVGQARHAGREQLEKAKQVAGAAKDAAQGEAERQGVARPRAEERPAQSTPAGRPAVIEPAHMSPAQGPGPRDPRT